MSDESDRRGFLKLALAAIAGVAGGHSILASNAFAQRSKATGGYIKVNVRPLTIKAPETLEYLAKGPNQRVLSRASQKQAAESIAPMVEHLVTAAGIKLNPDKMRQLHQAFLERGMILLRRGDGKQEATGTLSVEVTSLNWTMEAVDGSR